MIPGGCPKYIRAADVMWKQTFKRSLHDVYYQWMAGDADKEYTVTGYLKVPACCLRVDWVVAAWDKVDKDLIRESYRGCGLSVKTDGSENDLILCFREGQPCAAGQEALRQLRLQSSENRHEAAKDEDDWDNKDNKLVVHDVEEKANDNCKKAESYEC